MLFPPLNGCTIEDGTDLYKGVCRNSSRLVFFSQPIKSLICDNFVVVTSKAQNKAERQDCYRFI